MAEYTKGSWEVIPSASHVISSDGEGICKFESKHGMYDNYRANAQLISAAPEMYEALRWLLFLRSGISKGGDDFHVTEEEWNDAWNSAINALAKAEGRELE